MRVNCQRQRLLMVSGGFELACVLEAGEGGGALECLAQRIDALGGVFAFAILVDATECIVGEAADNEEAQRVTR